MPDAQVEQVEAMFASIASNPDAFAEGLQGIAKTIEEGTYKDAFEQDVVEALRTLACNADFVASYAE